MGKWREKNLWPCLKLTEIHTPNTSIHTIHPIRFIYTVPRQLHFLCSWFCVDYLHLITLSSPDSNNCTALMQYLRFISAPDTSPAVHYADNCIFYHDLFPLQPTIVWRAPQCKSVLNAEWGLAHWLTDWRAYCLGNATLMKVFPQPPVPLHTHL